MGDVRPALDLPHRHNVDAILLVTDGEADELCAPNICFVQISSLVDDHIERIAYLLHGSMIFAVSMQDGPQMGMLLEGARM